MKQQNQVSKKIEERGQIEDLRNYIRVGIDCEQTKLSWPQQCPNGTIIELKRNANAAEALVKAKANDQRTLIGGKYYLQAKCNGVPNQYDVYYEVKKAVPPSGNVPPEVFKLFSTPKACP